MCLSWPEIRAKAARFAGDWKDAHYERGESQTFYNEFFEVFGANRRRVASYEEPVKRPGMCRASRSKGYAWSMDNPASSRTNWTVSTETVATCPSSRTIYSGSSGRFGSFTMPERASVETRYWSTTHSSALRLPSLYSYT